MANDPDLDKFDDMAARIKQAEVGSKQRPSGDAPFDKGVIRASRAGMDFIAAVTVCAGLGWLADKYLGTSPWGILVLSLIGFVVGVMNVWRSLGGRPDGKME